MAQRPTCTGLRIRSTTDCNVIFHAVSLRILPMVSRRLSVDERRAIQSGCVFVWEERTPTIEAIGVATDGLERWTDSRRWGASRLTKDFLLYQEKLPDVGDQALLAAMFRNRLVKQTYSVFVETQEGRRKWHLVAYCSPETGDQLNTVDDFPQLGALRDQIPEGMYQPARCSKGRTRPDCEPEVFIPGGTLIEFTENPSPSPPGTASSGSMPAAKSASGPATASVPAAVSSLTAAAAPSPPSLARRPVPLKTALGHLPNVTLDPRRDPRWVLGNSVLVSKDIVEAQKGGICGTKGMPPLLYMRYSPYSPRHPLDNDALRAFDTVP